MLNESSKVKLFTHNDMDGEACEILGRLAFDNIDVTVVRNPQDASKKVSEFVNSGAFTNYDKIFITDISVDEATAELINNLEWELHRFSLLDHHGTAEFLNKYNWAEVSVKGALGKNSGTNMFYEFLLMHGFFQREIYRDALTVFVEKIRRYDTWEWKEDYNDIEASSLNQLFWLLGQSKFVDTFVKRFKNSTIFTVREGSWRQMFSDGDKVVIQIDNDKKESYIDRKEKQMMVNKLFGNKVGVVFAEQYISELGNTLSERHQDLKYIIMIDMGSKRVSYRTTHNDIDLGKEVAKWYGGGGHSKASGSSFEERVLNRSFKSIFRLGFIGRLKKIIDSINK
ncbi:DHH family phosphoesterase [Bacillus paranthracis]